MVLNAPPVECGVTINMMVCRLQNITGSLTMKMCGFVIVALGRRAPGFLKSLCILVLVLLLLCRPQK